MLLIEFPFFNSTHSYSCQRRSIQKWATPLFCASIICVYDIYTIIHNYNDSASCSNFTQVYTYTKCIIDSLFFP